jgi:hypothetical protein
MLQQPEAYPQYLQELPPLLGLSIAPAAQVRDQRVLVGQPLASSRSKTLSTSSSTVCPGGFHGTGRKVSG